MVEYTVESIEGFLAFIYETKKEEEKSDNKSDFLFRGQSCDLPLSPKIVRLSLRGKVHNIEKLIIEEFERQAFQYNVNHSNKWDMLSLAQHYGLPTRMLDWTFSFPVALWFAVKDGEKEKPVEDGVVYIFKATLEDFKRIQNEDDPFIIKQTLILRPKVISNRIAAQSGLFTVHKISESGIEISMENDTNFNNKLIKCIVPRKKFPEFRKQLNILGVNYHTMFPDLDGLSKHLTWRYSKYEDEFLLSKKEIKRILKTNPKNKTMT